MKNLTILAMAGALIMAMTPHAEAITQIPKTVCNKYGNGPVLVVEEAGFYVRFWCEEAEVDSPPDNAIQDWYYNSASGDFLHILTLRYECADPNDVSLMPANVVLIVCG